MRDLPLPPPPRRMPPAPMPRFQPRPAPVPRPVPFWDRHGFWVGVSWAILIVGLLLFNLGGVWRWSFFGG